MTKVFAYYIIYICTQAIIGKNHHKVKEKVVKEVLWINQRKGVLNHIVPKEDKNLQTKKLEAEVGNLKVQNADYSQIVGELSDKIKQYENKYGTVFTRGSSNNTK